MHPEKFEALKNYFEKILSDLPSSERPEAMDVPHFVHPELLKWALDDAILDIVEPILGPDIALVLDPLHLQAQGQRQARALA